MTDDWYELTKLIKDPSIIVERVKIKNRNIVLEGSFELPPLAQLSMEDQVFVIAFIRSHGSIKEMEKLYNISYPTVKNRLNHITSQLEFIEINPPATQNEILDMLASGELSVDEAIDKLRD